MAEVLSVSITKKQSEFLEAHNLSPSTLFQAKIAEQMDLFDTYNKDNANLLRIKGVLEQEMQLMNEFLDYVGKFDDWRKWRAEKKKDVV